MMIINNKYEIGQTVYLITDKEQDKRIIMAIRITPGGLLYECCCGIVVSIHYDFEISTEKDLINAV